MLSVREIRERLASFLAGKESLANFADWLSMESSRMRYDDDAESRELALSILNRIDVFSDGYISDAALQNELVILARPSEVQERAIRFVFMDEAVPPTAVPVKPDFEPSGRNSLVQFGVASFA